ncbi:spc97 / spc98 family protein [Sarocladium implicatum]|nr:spc97 / spc98 family protein [Sarocladium implicatum]
MNHREDEADLFAIPQLWRPSKWLDSQHRDTGHFFSTSLRSIADLEPPSNTQPTCENVYGGTAFDSEQSSKHLMRLSQPADDQSGFFRLPSFEDTPAQQHLDNSSSPHHDSPEATSTWDESDVLDVWADLRDPDAPKPTHKTWDGFLSGEKPTDQPLYLTEAGPAAYDALLSWNTDPLGLKNVEIPMVDAKAYFSSLLALAVGRESVFFFKSQDGRSLQPALQSVRISGYSSNAVKGLEKKCLECGKSFLALGAFVQKSYVKNSGRCTVALSSALSHILRILQRHVDIEAQDPRSLLQLQSTANNVWGVLQPLMALMEEVAQGSSDEFILSLVFKHACVMECKEAFVREIMQEILRVVSSPWLELLEEWVGTRSESGMPFTKANVGESKGFVKVESETCIDDFGEEFKDIDYRLDQRKLPDFFPTDIAQLAFDTGKNLRFIRSSCPEHVICRASATTVTRPFNAPAATWTFGWTEVLQLEKKVTEFQESLRNAIAGVATPHVSDRETPQARYGPQEKGSSLFGSTESQIESLILASMQQLETPIVSKATDNRFAEILNQNLRRRISPRRRQDLIAAPHPSLLPVLSFGGIIAAQAEIVNRESLKLLFDAHDLRSHLELQRSFQLLGNGMFCTQLSHALFDPDLETAERQAGIARQGGVMGLRLGARDTWPPASSELRLALMGILTDSFAAERGLQDSSRASSRKSADSLPGDLSFAVRDLAPEDIDKCMNPDSLEALDFLRLAYTTPPELRTIITPVILMQYDRIFKFLVRLLRLMYVVDQLFRVVNLRTSAWHEPGNTAYRFCREARHFVTCTSAYFLDTGIALPWQAFQVKMNQMQEELAETGQHLSGKACSPETLGEYHAQTVNQIMSALFLRKRQQPVLKLLDDIFITILTYAKHAQLRALGSVVVGEHTAAYAEKLYKDFRKKVQVFITVCRGLTEKSRSGAKRDGAARTDALGEDSMVAQLLLKLDMNHYYTKS